MLFIAYMIVNFIILSVKAIASSEYADREVQVHSLLVFAEPFIIF